MVYTERTHWTAADLAGIVHDTDDNGEDQPTHASGLSGI